MVARKITFLRLSVENLDIIWVLIFERGINAHKYSPVNLSVDRKLSHFLQV